MNKQKWFIQLKEQRLEALIRGGLLRQADARDKLIGFTQTVRRVLRTSTLPKEIMVLAFWSFVAIC